MEQKMLTIAKLRVRAMGSTTHTAWSRGSSRGTAVARDDVGKVDLMMLVANGWCSRKCLSPSEITDAWLVLKEMFEHYSL